MLMSFWPKKAARSIEEARDYYAKGVEVGELALGPRHIRQSRHRRSLSGTGLGPGNRVFRASRHPSRRNCPGAAPAAGFCGSDGGYANYSINPTFRNFAEFRLGPAIVMLL